MKVVKQFLNSKPWVTSELKSLLHNRWQAFLAEGHPKGEGVAEEAQEDLVREAILCFKGWGQLSPVQRKAVLEEH